MERIYELARVDAEKAAGVSLLARGGLDEFPEFVPKVEMFVTALRDSALPIETHGVLMRL